MLENYLIIAWRYILKYRVTSGIKIISLTLGLVCATLLLLYIKGEYSYDKFHKHSSRIFRLAVDLYTPTTHHDLALSAGPMGPAMKSDFPEVQNYVRIAKPGQQLLITQGKHRFFETEVVYADSSLFGIFSFPLLRGNPGSCLNSPESVVISQSIAEKYFGQNDPIDQELQIDGDTYKITGIMENIPQNSHLSFNLVLPIQNFSASLENNWSWYPVYTYLLVKPEVNREVLSEKLPEFLNKYVPDNNQGSRTELSLQPLGDLYLNSNRLAEAGPSGNRTSLVIMVSIAVIILLISALNFINISTAQSLNMVKEVGVRKVIGSGKGQLIVRFLCESLLLSIISFIFSIILLVLIWPWFQVAAGKTIMFSWDQDWHLLILFAAGALGLGLLAGSYPSWLISRSEPQGIIKGEMLTIGKSIHLKSALVVVQFVISIILIIGVLTINSQITFLRSHELGFDKEHTLIINFGNDSLARDKQEVIKTELLSLPGVEAASFSSHQPGSMGHGLFTSIELPDGREQQGEISLYLVDFDFIHNYGLQVIAGRSFSPDFSRDTAAAMILNQAALKQFGFNSPEEAIDQSFVQWGREGQIIGVIKDFNYLSLHHPIEPLSFQVWPEKFERVSLKISSDNLTAIINGIGDRWSQLLPHLPFDYQFLDLSFDQQYHSEMQLQKLYWSFTAAAMLIASLGLLGLSLLSLNNRSKEIAVRKVHGAEVGGIISWLAKGLLKNVLIAFLLAAPTAYLLMVRWLQGYAYQVRLGAGIFAFALLLAVAIALVTISFQVIRAARVNPIRFLQYQ